jgi:hypothetical protein
MPRQSCWFIRASLLHLSVGVVLGGLILSAKGFPAALGWAWLLLPAHIQVLVGGWLIQLTLGMAYWILPRLDGVGERGSPGWAWTSFGALNGGVGGAALLLIARTFRQAAWLDALLIVAAGLQLLALLTFARHAWPRIQPITVSAEHKQRTA